MKTTHTPGPWSATIYAGAFDQAIVKSETDTICRVHGQQNRQHEANALLIAAAPELLEILQGLYKECAMIHKYGGEICNQKEADAVINTGKALLERFEQ
jgi:hypothetical protein